jgi:hypothetical protein
VLVMLVQKLNSVKLVQPRYEEANKFVTSDLLTPYGASGRGASMGFFGHEIKVVTR